MTSVVARSPQRHGLRAAATAAALLTGPTVIAFFSGGYFDVARMWGCVIAWTAVGVAAVVARNPLPRTAAARLSLAGLAGLTTWTALSITWAPLRGPAFHDMERLLLYTGVMIAAVALLRGRPTAALVEPVLAAGIVIVIGYALAARLLPGLVREAASASAAGRLEQPLTYWNATGALAAIGFVLCARIAGDVLRPGWLRATAAATAPLLGAGVYLSFSRGALAALAFGLLVLIVAAPTWPQLRAIALVVLAGALAVVPADLLHSVRTLSGSAGTREAQGAAMLAVLLAITAGTAAVQILSAGRGRAGPLPRLRRRYVTAAIVVALAVAAVAAASSKERHTAQPPRGATNARLGSFESNRYAYWRVAARAFADHPLRGLGSGGFQVVWLERRNVADDALDAHSLYLETAAELGVVGLALLAMFLGGAAAAARRAYRTDRALTAGWIAAGAAWALHTGIDWDWEMPALSLVALLLIGALVAAGDGGAGLDEPQPPPAG
jgi:hypothetical protein